ncbi:MAG: hypothetical protein HRU10_07385 [Opitutales bacterium]|nr:hypothetical protein [Opitutales bacterium]
MPKLRLLPERLLNFWGRSRVLWVHALQAAIAIPALGILGFPQPDNARPITQHTRMQQ